MKQRILVVGAGFAGMWSALGAARLLDSAAKADGAIEIALIAPKPELHLRPRLHEASPQNMKVPLTPLFEAVGIRFVQGVVEHIHADTASVEAVGHDGKRFEIAYDRLVLASGSRLNRPNLPGLDEHAHSIDQLDEAAELEAHLHRLAAEPETAARNTVVIVGGGFTGVEIACELSGRLREIFGPDATGIKLIILEQADALGPELGAAPRPVIEQALTDLGVKWCIGTSVSAIDADGLTTSKGERIAARTIIWTAGMRASPLTREIASDQDPLGRLHVGDDLRVKGCANIFATGDVAFARTDGQGHHALMSCQHAMTMGKFAGHNVAADLLGLQTVPYRQERYVTCLDLGPWGAMLTEGWSRTVKLFGPEAKATKRAINTRIIYPPLPDRVSALAAADIAPAVVS